MFLLILLQPAPPSPLAPAPVASTPGPHPHPGPAPVAGVEPLISGWKYSMRLHSEVGFCLCHSCRLVPALYAGSTKLCVASARSSCGPHRAGEAEVGQGSRPPARHGTAGLPVPAPSDSSELTGGPHLCFSPAGVVGSPVPQGHPCRLQGLHPVPLPRQSAEKGPELGPTASSLPGPHFPPGLPDGAFGLRWPQAQAAPGRGLCTAPHEHRPPSVLWPRAA